MMKQTTLTEKRFFEWHEDNVSVTLRNKGGSYGGGSEVFIVSMSSERCNTTITKDRTGSTSKLES